MLGWWRQKIPPQPTLPHKEVEEEWSQKLIENMAGKWAESMT
jgi:hypothetical protein